MARLFVERNLSHFIAKFNWLKPMFNLNSKRLTSIFPNQIVRFNFLDFILININFLPLLVGCLGTLPLSAVTNSSVSWSWDS